MEYIILDKNLTLNGVDVGNFINITEVNTNAITGDSVANINISNTEMYFTVAITTNGIKQSIEEFFDVLQDKE